VLVIVDIVQTLENVWKLQPVSIIQALVMELAMYLL
jgi:hypothetical protein